jgi:hypothetical protein
VGRFSYEGGTEVQAVSLHVDAGYGHVGFSAQSGDQELIGGEVKLLKKMSERLRDRVMYRRQRRSRLWYRRAKFKDGGTFASDRPDGWLAPSIRHKLDAHLTLIRKIRDILPIASIQIETANFDIQKIQNPDIEGTGYQQGQQAGFWNLREYILHRDGHACQHPDCRNRSQAPILQVHHIGYWKGDRSDRPGNLITLCTRCHTPRNHQPGGRLQGWNPKVPSFRGETFMTSVRRHLVAQARASFGIPVSETFGYLTKQRRIAQGLTKSHHHDAFAMGEATWISRPYVVEQIRRNNRSLEKFYDAQYHSLETGQKASGQNLSSGRRVRNKLSTKNGPNRRPLRGHKLNKGRRSIRRQRHPMQPGDLVRFQGNVHRVKGTHNQGASVQIILPDGKLTSRSPKRMSLVCSRKGMCFSLTPKEHFQPMTEKEGATRAA